MNTARSVPAGNGVTWLTRGFGTLRRHPGTLAGAVFLLILAAILPIGVQLAGQFLLAGSAMSLVVQLLATVAMMFIMSLVVVGLMRLIDSLERNGTGSAFSIFATFGDAELMARAAVFALIVLVASALFIVLLLMTLGPEMLAWYKSVLTQPMAATAAAPPITGSPWLSALVGIAGALALFGVNTFGYAQVALTRASGTEAFQDGLGATARNLLPILLNLVVVIVVMVLLAIPMVILMAVLGFVGALVHPLGGLVLAVPLYVGFLLALYALIFATMYHAWRDVFDGGEAVLARAPDSVQA